MLPSRLTRRLSIVSVMLQSTSSMVKISCYPPSRYRRSGNDCGSGGIAAPPLSVSCMKAVSSQRPCL